MDNLSMCKAIAKLEGVNVNIVGNNPFTPANPKKFKLEAKYNPIDDLALNCMLRDKYEVNILHDYNEVEVEIGDGDFKSLAVVECKKEDIPRAVIECILKANNLWVGD